jgi:FkbM family methyltransferase
MKVSFPIGTRLQYAFRRIHLAWMVRSGRSHPQDLDAVFSAAGIDREPGETAVVSHLAARLGYRKMLDIGANHGDFSRNVRHRMPLDVILVEPNPSLVERLREWSRTESGVSVLHAAVSGQAGSVDLFVPFGHTGGAHLGSPSEANRSGLNVKVTAVTLSDLLIEHGPDFVKIDVEGHEAEVFSGVRRYLESVQQPCIFGFECSDPRLFERVRSYLPGFRFCSLEPYWPSGRGGWSFASGVFSFLLRRDWAVRPLEALSDYQGLIFAVPATSKEAAVLSDDSSVARANLRALPLKHIG